MFNYLEPPNAYYEFERIYSVQQWQRKQKWISHYLAQHQPNIIGFQEVFSPNSLQALVKEQGYQNFAVVDEATVVDDFIYQSPVVALASHYPIVETTAVPVNRELAQSLGLAEDFSFSRKILRATVDVPHIGYCDCYVVHLKSKRSMLDAPQDNNYSDEKNIFEQLKAQIAGGWGSTLQRGSEATLLFTQMLTRREQSQQPMMLMGDFNSTLSDGVLSHLLTHHLPFANQADCKRYLDKYCLHDAWELHQSAQLRETALKESELQHLNSKKLDSKKIEPTETNDNDINSKDIQQERAPTHYFGAKGSVLDYILLSCEFDASYHDSFYQVSDYHTYDRHLINPIFEQDDLSTDHAVVSVTLRLRS
ncbi:endonuclease/exonuclease/phosphatase family protein [Thalassotalea sp. PLHSN55]|uniref:endonuclease/exonuclease/phosphatase family protein n=1 Tax=Thalassotalea sp. PLHSN55 TaxID=3435888 RepID=UPI003F87D6F6